MLLPKVTKRANLLLVIPATNATSEWSFSEMKCIITYLRNTASGNRLNHCMMLHIHFKMTNQLNMIEIAKEFVGDSQVRLPAFGRF